MFPDPTLRLKPYPSIISGMACIYVFDMGAEYGTLHLVVTGDGSSTHFGIHVPCDAYFGVDEMYYSLAEHGIHEEFVDKRSFIKEAEDSLFLKKMRALATDFGLKESFRHFIFVGNEYCYETLGTGEPVVKRFENREAAEAWKPTQTP